MTGCPTLVALHCTSGIMAAPAAHCMPPQEDVCLSLRISAGAAGAWPTCSVTHSNSCDEPSPISSSTPLSWRPEPQSAAVDSRARARSRSLTPHSSTAEQQHLPPAATACLLPRCKRTRDAWEGGCGGKHWDFTDEVCRQRAIAASSGSHGGWAHHQQQLLPLPWQCQGKQQCIAYPEADVTAYYHLIHGSCKRVMLSSCRCSTSSSSSSSRSRSALERSSNDAAQRTISVVWLRPSAGVYEHRAQQQQQLHHHQQPQQHTREPSFHHHQPQRLTAHSKFLLPSATEHQLLLSSRAAAPSAARALATYPCASPHTAACARAPTPPPPRVAVVSVEMLLARAGCVLDVACREVYLFAQHMWARVGGSVDELLIASLGATHAPAQVALLVTLWIASKLEGHRKEVVGASRVCAATGLSPWGVTSVEVHILQALDFSPYRGW